MDAVAPKLLVLKGDGLVRMFQGSYSEVRVRYKCGCIKWIILVNIDTVNGILIVSILVTFIHM